MGAGSKAALPERTQQRIQQAIESCRSQNGLDVSVLVGDLVLDDLKQFRSAAEKLHAALGDERSKSAVLVVVAPGQHRVEVVTGPKVRRRVPDRVCSLAVLSMTTAFSGGDLAGGIVDALRQFADAAGRREGLSALEEKPAELAASGHH